MLAGCNGAGKSSIGGAAFRAAGTDYFNPDEAARAILALNARRASISHELANSAAWAEGRRLLERAIRERRNFAFETTLGGHTITDLLLAACEAGIEVHIWFAGLERSRCTLNASNSVWRRAVTTSRRRRFASGSIGAGKT